MPLLNFTNLPILIFLLSTNATGLSSQTRKSRSQIVEARKYFYDEKTGTCKDSNGQMGYNSFNFDTLFKSPDKTKLWINRDAECVDLSNIDITSLLDPSKEGIYATLKGWNFRGAKLEATNLHFIFIVEADLRGSRFISAKLSYSTVSGRIDGFSQLHSSCSSANTEKIQCVL